MVGVYEKVGRKHLKHITKTCNEVAADIVMRKKTAPTCVAPGKIKSTSLVIAPICLYTRMVPKKEKEGKTWFSTIANCGGDGESTSWKFNFLNSPAAYVYLFSRFFRSRRRRDVVKTLILIWVFRLLHFVESYVERQQFPVKQSIFYAGF